MYDRILIAVDGSECATRAVRYGLELAKRFDAAVEVIHVVDAAAAGVDVATAEQKRLQRERGEATLADVESLAVDAGQRVTTHLAWGRPAAMILERIDEYGADPVAMGTRGRSGIGRLLLGSVTETVLRAADVSVLAVPAAEGPVPETFDRILVPTDGSENAEEALPAAADVARAYGAVVHVLTVVDVQAAGGLFSAGGVDHAFVERLDIEAEAIVERAAERLRTAAPEVTVETAVIHDRPPEGIRTYAANHDVDLVVIAPHGRGRVGRLLVGSVTERLLRLVDVPTLVVR